MSGAVPRTLREAEGIAREEPGRPVGCSTSLVAKAEEALEAVAVPPRRGHHTPDIPPQFHRNSANCTHELGLIRKRVQFGHSSRPRRPA